MKQIVMLFACVILCNFNVYAHGDKENEKKYRASAKKHAYIISPKNGETVPKTFKVVFGLEGMIVSPAGVEKANSGHHHLLIDANKLPDLSVPLGNSVKHFGGGQTETSLTLPSGSHTLQLILADHKHLPHSPAIISTQITIMVE